MLRIVIRVILRLSRCFLAALVTMRNQYEKVLFSTLRAFGARNSCRAKNFARKCCASRQGLFKLFDGASALGDLK